MDEKEALKLAAKYPQQITAYPRTAFEKQLADFLMQMKGKNGS